MNPERKGFVYTPLEFGKGLRPLRKKTALANIEKLGLGNEVA